MSDERYEQSHPEMDARKLQTMAATIDDQLPPGFGFGLFVFTFEGNTPDAMFWISNAQRPLVIESLKEWIAHQENRK